MSKFEIGDIIKGLPGSNYSITDMMKGWEQSKGANREYGYALGKGYQILQED